MIARLSNGFTSSIRRSRSATPPASRCPDWCTDHQRPLKERGQRRLDFTEFRDARDVLRRDRHGGQRRQHQQDALLLRIERGHRLVDQLFGRDGVHPRIEQTAAIAEKTRGDQDSLWMARERSTQTSGGASFVVLDRARYFTFQELERVLDWQPLQGEAAHLAMQALLARRDDEPGAGSGIEQPFELFPLQQDVIDQDQRAFVLKSMPDVRRRGLPDPVALIEAVEELLLQVARGLLPGGEVDDAVDEGRRLRMVGERSKQRCLADAGVPDDLDGKSSAERREDGFELRSSAEQPTHRSRAEKYRRGAGQRGDGPRWRRFTHPRAMRPTDTQYIPAGRYFNSQRAGRRGSFGCDNSDDSWNRRGIVSRAIVCNRRQS